MKPLIAAFAFVPGLAVAEPLFVPFDFSGHELALDVTVKGTKLRAILDTGVDPSAIDLHRTEALGLKLDRAAGGEASGEGNDKAAKAYPVPIDDLAVAGRNFGMIDGLAVDMSALSAQFGSTLDLVIGYSFLKDRIVLIDYPKRTIGILDVPGDAASSVISCKKHVSLPLESFPDDSIPKIPDFRLGKASGPISLDTGSNGGIMLYPAALDLPGVRKALAEKGEITHTGARGAAKSKTFQLKVPVGFDPFTLPAGQLVALRGAAGADTRIANIGNKLFDALKLKMLLNYRDHVMTFYGDCR